ncbi:Pentatricopeptide repeat-containing protein isoform 1 [Dorcoceras hygrometricum]|uniref:Pentatricopeptide repeat-containing protein isoform 1 n=1 Tax=Dorcoceras hygrometricum TaxID=472368 RepID=A0A2Z7B8W0_9LAMI|nr:Pentatricopeptide repeat-containing protein isoform 1 [Dorcoceras hygrometricum]
MADDTDEVFDFSNVMFTREDLINALNEMVYEYKKLYQTFEDVKAKNKCLKDKSDDASFLQLDDSDSLKELTKALAVKAGYFDAVTHSQFDLMVAIMGGIRINWSRILFRILKAMVVPSTKQAHGFAVQLSLQLEGVPRLNLGKSKALLSLKILSVKSVDTFVAKNKSAQADLVEEKEFTGDTERTTASKAKWLEEILEVPHDETLPLAVLYRTLRAKHYPPSATTRKPITEIRWSQGIHIREVNWCTRSILKIAPVDMGKEILVEIPKGNLIKETINLIFVDLEFFIKIRDQYLPKGLEFIFMPRCGYSRMFGFLYLATNNDSLVQFTEATLDTVFRDFQHGQRAEHFFAFFEEGAHEESDGYHETHLIVTVHSEYVPSRLCRQNEDKAARA